MVIEVLKNKYKCGCNKGIAKLDQPDILEKLNSIIEWDICKFPERSIIETENDEWNKYFGPDCEEIEYKEVQDENGVKCRTFEDRNFLGALSELKPGNCFLFDGQFIAVDSADRLVLMFSGSGYKALDRLWEEEICPELRIFYGDNNVNNVEYKGLDKEPDYKNEFNLEVRIPYLDYNKWKTYFLDGNDKIPTLEGGKHAVLCKLDSEDLPFEFEFIMTDHCAFFRGDEIDEEDKDIAEMAVRQTISWFYGNTKRSINPLDIESKKQQEISDYQQKKQFEEMMKTLGGGE